MRHRPATVAEARAAWAALDAKLRAMQPEDLTAAQLENWLTGLEGKPVRIAAPAWCSPPAPLEASGMLSSAMAEQHPDLGLVLQYELDGPGGLCGSFYIVPDNVIRAYREYVNGQPRVRVDMRAGGSAYRITITALLADLTEGLSTP